MSKKVSTETENNKRLRIQLAVCKRLQKEVASYEAEVQRNEIRIQKMRDDGKDFYGNSTESFFISSLLLFCFNKIFASKKRFSKKVI